MKTRIWLVSVTLITMAAAQIAVADDSKRRHWTDAPIVKKIRTATAAFRDADAAIAAGYVNTGNCVSGRNGGAMGVHFANFSLIGDGVVDASMPEILVYEPQRNGRLRLVAVEYLQLDDGDPATGSPVVDGHLMNVAGAPNRYGLPAHHELHVWAWRYNPNGLFTDWNARVSCDAYKPA